MSAGSNLKSSYEASVDRLSNITNSDAAQFAMDSYQLYNDIKTIQDYGVEHDDRLDAILAKVSLANTAYSGVGSFLDHKGLKGGAGYINSLSMKIDMAIGSVAFTRMFQNIADQKYDKAISNFFVAASSSTGILEHATEKATGKNFSKATIGTTRMLFTGASNFIESEFFELMVYSATDRMEEIADARAKGIEMTSQAIESAVNSYNKAVEGTSRMMENAVETAKRIKEGAENLAEAAVNLRDKVAESIKDGVDKGIKEAYEAYYKAQQEAMDAYNGVKEFFKDLKEQVTDKAKDKIDEYAKKFNETVEETKREFETWKDKFDEMWEDFKDDLPDPRDWLPDWLPDSFAQWFDIPNRTGQHYFYDPLVLDLDGDGIETTAVHAQYSKNAFFDFDGDGSYHATGWVKKDDGILVRDINGDGIINNGTELFGDSTLKMDGTRARHGFDALSDLDSNRDGMIDARDDAFDSLLVWQDANTNGISEASELRTLSELGITKLNLAHTDTNQNLYNKNTLTHLGSYTKADGTVHKMGDVNFAFSRVHAQLTQPVEVSDEIRQLANLTGRGRVTDLHHAMMTSVALTTIVKDYMSTTTKTEQMAKLDGLLQAWAQTDGQYQEYTHDIGTSKVSAQGVGTGVIGGDFIDKNNHEAALAQFDTIKHKIGVLDSLLGSKTDQLYYAGTRTLIQTNKIINDSYDKLISHTYAALYPQTDNYLELYQMVDVSLALVGTKMQLQMDFSRLAQHIADELPMSDEQHFVKVVEFLAYLSSTPHYQSASIIHMDKILQQVQDATADLPKQIMQTWVQGVNESILSKSKLTLGTEVVDTGRDVNLAFGNHGNDRLHGTRGDDVLLGGTGNDYLEGGTGNDTLIGGTGDDRLYGGAGADTYVFNKGHGRDVIADSEFTSTSQQAPMDKIVFNDILSKDIKASLRAYDLTLHSSENDSVMIQSHNLNEASQIEQIEFTDKTLSMKDYLSQLTASIDSTSGNDRIEANYWLGSVDGQLGDGDDEFRINLNAKSAKIDGGAGSDYLISGNANDTLIGGDGNDRLYAKAGDDELYGGDGNDTLYGDEGNDILEGGTGNDHLEGGTGNDTLIGGTGDDRLYGGAGADTYVFGQNLGLELDAVYGNGFDQIRDFNLSQGDQLDLSGLFDSSATIDSLLDFVQFERASSNVIRVSIDRDGTGDVFDRTAIADLYVTGNINNTLNQLNQGVGVII